MDASFNEAITGLIVIGSFVVALFVVFRHADGSLRETPRTRSLELLDEFCERAKAPTTENDDGSSRRDAASRSVR